MRTTGKYETLQFGKTYHIFNKANGMEKLFLNRSDYLYFLKKLERFLIPWMDVLAYCLIPNHFHLLITVKNIEDIRLTHSQHKALNVSDLSKVFSNFFNSYSKSFNKAHNRHGKLFLLPFKRIVVNNERLFNYLICYIHRNPIHHGLVNDYNEWEFSSYNAILSDKPTHIKRKDIIAMFGSKEEFLSFHQENKTKKGLKEYLTE